MADYKYLLRKITELHPAAFATLSLRINLVKNNNF
jgi:hypothetical protein